MLKLAKVLILMSRTKEIKNILLKNHNFDIREDLESLKFVMLMVKESPLSNEEIAKEFLEMHMIQNQELFARK